MEAQMQRPDQDVGLHSGESNQPGEKKSVLQKVKDKAKRLKDTIKKPGQGQEHEYRYDDHPDEDEDDEEMATDHDIHGAPTHDSTVIKSKNLPMQGDEGSDPMDLGEDPHSQKRPGDAPTGDESKTTGGKEAGVDPLLRRFDNLNVDDESETKPELEPSTLDNPESGPKIFDSNEKEGVPRDTMTGKVSSATSAITNRAISAKNAVASKLGYGGGSEQKELCPPNKPESESTPGYTQKITDTLNPVYEKVAGAGTAVLSRFQGGGPGQEGVNPSDKPQSGSTPGYTQKITETLNPVYEKVAGAGTAVMSKFQSSGEAGNKGGDAADKGTDKGVSMKDYVSEKLKPGDEDKALSEAITDALHKKKEGYFQKPGVEKPTGKVTESEEVADHLGTGLEGRREGEDALNAGRESSGPGVVGRVKDAVGSWIGMGTGTQTAQDSINESYVDKADTARGGSDGQGAGEQRRLQQE